MRWSCEVTLCSGGYKKSEPSYGDVEQCIISMAAADFGCEEALNLMRRGIWGFLGCHVKQVHM